MIDMNSFWIAKKQRLWIATVILVIASLACSLFGTDSSPDSGITIFNRLTTLTPTPERLANTPSKDTSVEATPEQIFPTATPLPATQSANAVAAISPPTTTPWPTTTPTATPTPRRTATPDGFYIVPISTEANTAGGWGIENVEIYINEEEGVTRLYGELINNTAATQELAFITGTFSDVQNQIVANEENVTDYWPNDIIPQGQRMPFELFIETEDIIDSYDLQVEAQSNNEVIYTDFAMLDQYEQPGEFEYCLGGTVQNNGSAVESYILIIATLYNTQSNVLNFGDYYEPMAGDNEQLLPFEICIEPPVQPVGQYKFQIWGQ